MIKFFESSRLPSLLLMLCIPFCLGLSRDPTRPPDNLLNSINNNLEISDKPLKLLAIFNYPEFKVAIINGDFVKEGDRIGEYVVTTISKDTVELSGAKNKGLRLNLTESVKTSTEH